MSRTNLIISDVVFVLTLVSIYKTDGLKTYPIILGPFIITAFATCVIRHISYYNMTKRIY